MTVFGKYFRVDCHQAVGAHVTTHISIIVILNIIYYKIQIYYIWYNRWQCTFDIYKISALVVLFILVYVYIDGKTTATQKVLYNIDISSCKNYCFIRFCSVSGNTHVRTQGQHDVATTEFNEGNIQYESLNEGRTSDVLPEQGWSISYD